jgi:carbon-monoxide dehydrogenase medium subunit
MYSFDYVRPATLDQALALLRENPDARPISGGMTLIPTLKARLAQPSHLVDLGRLQELRGLALDNGVLRIGAATTHAQVARAAQVRSGLPALAELAGQIGDPAVRNLGTIGGSVANNDPAADYPAALLALGATVCTSARQIHADDFFQGMFTTALEPDELVVRIDFPLAARAGYLKFRHPASGYAMAGVFVADTDHGIRVAVTGAGPGVFRWTQAEEALAGRFSVDAIRTLHVAADDLNQDMHGSREYRANLVNVLATRVVARLTGENHG